MLIKEKLVQLINSRISILESEKHDLDLVLDLSLSAFNLVPCITYFTFKDEENINQLKDILVTYACYIILTKRGSIVGNNAACIDSISLARELWNNWEIQVHNLKESESFYEDFVQDPCELEQ